ncbi:hypothetical protein [Streptomyces triticagri]|nr:hypothetical protein [Streptomyces triticagri]
MPAPMRPRSAVLASAALCAALLPAVAACGAEDLVAGAVARTGAAQAGAVAFRESGHELKGKLKCSTHDETDKKLDVRCTGTTTDGKPAKMTATLTTDAKVVSGDGAKISGATVTGTVDGEEVFQKDCIGEGC